MNTRQWTTKDDQMTAKDNKTKMAFTRYEFEALKTQTNIEGNGEKRNIE